MSKQLAINMRYLLQDTGS